MESCTSSARRLVGGLGAPGAPTGPSPWQAADHGKSGPLSGVGEPVGGVGVLVEVAVAVGAAGVGILAATSTQASLE